MKNALKWIGRAAVLAGLGSLALSQERPPDQPFQAVHMLTVLPNEEKELLAATEDINRAIAKAGCPACIYHLSKVYGQPVGPFNYLQISNWPGREIYEKVHNSEEYNAAGKRHADILNIVYRVEVYNRYVEVKIGH
jgi:hypothetical protein